MNTPDKRQTKHRDRYLEKAFQARDNRDRADNRSNHRRANYWHRYIIKYMNKSAQYLE